MSRRWRFLHAAATLERGARWGIMSDVENAVSFGVSHIKAVGVAIVAAILFVVGSPAIVSALTKEEASRCRAMRNYIERRDCFESLKEESKAKAEEAAKSKTGSAPSPRRRMSQPPPLLIVLTSLLVSPFAWIATHSPRSLLPVCLLPVRRKRLRNGCQAIPEDAKVELLERYPNGLHFLRVIKVY